ncbi:endonuclease/exonuclease/phosphatase family protein, partial [Candidatus Sumerlaeota bacterium]
MKLPKTRRGRWGLLIAGGVLGLIAGLGALFAINGLLLSSGGRVLLYETGAPTTAPPGPGAEIRVVSYNIAKAFAHQGGTSFASPAVIKARLERCAQAIAPLRPDLVFL